MKIVAHYNRPSTFLLDPPSYRAASALNLTCEVEGVEGTELLYYEWTSACTGSCFTTGLYTKVASTPYLHSYDTGVHTCKVYDSLGCSGSADISINVVGMFLA